MSKSMVRFLKIKRRTQKNYFNKKQTWCPLLKTCNTKTFEVGTFKKPIMKKYINVGFMAIFTLMTFVLSFSSCSSDELLDGTTTLPENAIAFNVTQQGALSRGTETNSVA